MSTHSSEGGEERVSERVRRWLEARSLTASSSEHDTRVVVPGLGEMVRSSSLEGTVDIGKKVSQSRGDERRAAYAEPAMGQAVSSLAGQRVGFLFFSFLTRARWRTGSLMQVPSLKVNFSGQVVIWHWEATQTARRGSLVQGKGGESSLLVLTTVGTLGKEDTWVVERATVVNCEEGEMAGQRPLRALHHTWREARRKLTIRGDIDLVADTIAKSVAELALAGEALAGDTDGSRGAVRLANLADGTAVVEVTSSRTL